MAPVRLEAVQSDLGSLFTVRSFFKDDNEHQHTTSTICGIFTPHIRGTAVIPTLDTVSGDILSLSLQDLTVPCASAKRDGSSISATTAYYQSVPIMSGIWLQPPPPPQLLSAGPLRIHLLIGLCTPALWLLFNILVSEVLFVSILAVIGVRMTRHISRLINVRASLHDRLGRRRQSHLEKDMKLSSVQQKTRKSSTLQRDLGYATLDAPKRARGCHTRISRRIITLNDKTLFEPLVLPLDVEPRRPRTSIFSTAADTLVASPRHVIKNEKLALPMNNDAKNGDTARDCDN